MATWIEGFLESESELARLPVVARSAHSTHFELGAGVQRAVITSAPQYFRSPQGWQAYDLQLRADAAARWGAPGAPAHLAADGSVWLGEYQQHTRSVGVLVDDVYTPLCTLPEGRVAGPRLVRETIPFRHELLLTEDGVKEELHISALPDGLEGGYLVYETHSRGARLGLSFSPGSSMDAAGRAWPLHRFEVGGVTYTGLAAEDLARAEFPLVIDPTVSYASAGDGTITGYSGSYTTAHTTSVHFDSGATELIVGQAFDTGIPRFYMFRAAIKFSLASLNPLAVIYAANLRMVCTMDESTLADFGVQIVKHNWAAQDPLTNGNREAVFDACLAGTTDAVWKNTSAITVNTQYTSAPLDVNWLTPGGTVYYSLRSSRDAAGVIPPANGNEYVRLGAGAHSNVNRRPALIVDYFAVPSATGKLAQPNPRVRIEDTRIKLRARRRKTLLDARNRGNDGR